MYDPGTGRFLSRDPLSEGPQVVYGHEYVARFARSLNPYTYCENNPVNLIDPSGLACLPPPPPKNIIPPEDDYFPVSQWNTTLVRFGISLSFGNSNRVKYTGVFCGICKMDLEIRADGFRYFRFSQSLNDFIDHTGGKMPGAGTDPRDFFSVVMMTVCKTNINCCGQKQPDLTQSFISEPFQKNSLGVFLRQGKGDIETSLIRFVKQGPPDPCNFPQDAFTFLKQNTLPGEIPK